MKSLLQKFVGLNRYLCEKFDDLLPFPPSQVGSLGEFDVRPMFLSSEIIADVGGGKKPFAVAADIPVGNRRYFGLDIEEEELKSAPANTYTNTFVVNIENPQESLENLFEFVICRNTLEHVKDAEKAISGLCAIMAPGGSCYIKLPCRYAAFARANRLLPNELKRRLMHSIFPHKSGDGFPAYYDRASPGELRTLIRESGAETLAERRTYRSSYFMFFFPAYILWRLFATLQYLFNAEYCENFELVFRKMDASKNPASVAARARDIEKPR